MSSARCFTVSVLVVVAFMATAPAQQSEATVKDATDLSVIPAARLMQRIDKNGNGTFEKDEDAATWQRYQRLDANRDGVLTIEELGRQTARFVEMGGRRKVDIVYKRAPQGELKLDLYYPTDKDAAAPFPVVLYTHGGGWAAGSKQGIAKGSFSEVFTKLLAHGFAAASVDYRLCRPNNGVTIRDCVTDCKDAARYLARHSEELQLDRDRFFVMGDSAGGHLAQMLLLTSPDTFVGDRELAGASYKMVAGVSWYGPCDFEKIDLFNHDDRADFRDRFAPRILGPNPDPATRLQRYREISPVNYLRTDSPPLLMIQGDRDTTIPVKHAYYMKQKAEAVSAPIEIMIIKNAGHNWRKVGDEIDPARDTIVERTVQFLVDHLTDASRR